MLMATEDRKALVPIRSAISARDWEVIGRRALEIAASLDARQGDFYAEFVPGIAPTWSLITVSPGQEKDAIADLIRRRFGVYDAMFDECHVVRGKPRMRRTRLLPGYLLVFCWGVDRHWERIAACTGVTGMLRHAGTMEPFAVPDEFVTFLQCKELTQAFGILTPKASRRRKRYSTVEQTEPVIFHTKSYLHGPNGLADGDRIASLFERAIGLAS